MYIGMDIGGTFVRIGLFDAEDFNKLVYKEKFPNNQHFETGISKIIDKIRVLTEGRTVEGIGIGTAGVVNTELGCLETSTNLPDWRLKPIAGKLKEELKTDVKLENDAVALATGEYLMGHGTGMDKFLYIIWGTGIGGCKVENFEGKLKIIPFEPGHQIINWNGNLCLCGQKGCLETYIGGGQAQNIYGKPLEEVDDENIWEEISQNAARGFLNTIIHHPVKLMIFGGGVITRQQHLLARIKTILDKELTTYPVPELKITKFGEDAALFGAVSLFKHTKP